MVLLAHESGTFQGAFFRHTHSQGHVWLVELDVTKGSPHLPVENGWESRCGIGRNPCESHLSSPNMAYRAVDWEMHVLWPLWATVIHNHHVGDRLAPWKGQCVRTLGHCNPRDSVHLVLPLSRVICPVWGPLACVWNGRAKRVWKRLSQGPFSLRAGSQNGAHRPRPVLAPLPLLS